MSALVPISKVPPEASLLALIPLVPLSSSNVLAGAQVKFPGGTQIDLIGTFAGRLIGQFFWLLDWAVRNWYFTMLVLIALVYWASRQRRLDRHHL